MVIRGFTVSTLLSTWNILKVVNLGQGIPSQPELNRLDSNGTRLAAITRPSWVKKWARSAPSGWLADQGDFEYLSCQPEAALGMGLRLLCCYRINMLDSTKTSLKRARLIVSFLRCGFDANIVLEQSQMTATIMTELFWRFALTSDRD